MKQQIPVEVVLALLLLLCIAEIILLLLVRYTVQIPAGDKKISEEGISTYPPYYV